MRQGCGWLLSALAGAVIVVLILALLGSRFNDRSVVGAIAVAVGVTIIGGLYLLVRGARSLDLEFRRQQSGQCIHCGYDLRGSQECGRCPECGASFKIES